MSDIRLILCTFPDADQARRIGRILVEARLAACVNLIPGVESIYHWQGAVETSAEVLAVFKTTVAAYPALEERLRELHPYEVPEIISLQPEQVAETYARWVSESVLVAGA
jgi:periplasmic divalent cation tolerance protein